jgi:hypothetical protein
VADSNASSSKLEARCSRGPPVVRDGVGAACAMHGKAAGGGAAAELSLKAAPTGSTPGVGRPLLARKEAGGAEGMEGVRSSKALANREPPPPKGSCCGREPAGREGSNRRKGRLTQ